MTLDETIKEFTDWAKDNRKEQNYWAAERDENDETNPLSYADCEGLARDAETRAEYHEQLAEWLTELKELREQSQKAKSMILDYSYTVEVMCNRIKNTMGCENCTYCNEKTYECKVGAYIARTRAFVKGGRASESD